MAMQQILIGYSLTTGGGDPDPNYSVLFDGDGDYLRGLSYIPSIGTSDFTVEFWTRFADGNPSDLETISDTRSSSGSSNGFLIGRFHTSGHENQIELYTGGNYTGVASGALSNNTWHHIAVVKSGTTNGVNGTVKMYVNGLDTGTSYTDSNNYTNNDITIGANLATTYFMNGNIADYRQTQSDLYTSNFTPPTAKLEELSATQFLCCQSSTDPGGATTGTAITPYGDAQVSSQSPTVADPYSSVSELMFVRAGSYSFTPPPGVTSVDVVCVGGGGGCAHYPNSVTGTSGGGGGSLSYKNNITVSSSETYTITVGNFGGGVTTQTSYPIPIDFHTTSSSSNAGDGEISSFKLGGTTLCDAAGGAGADVGSGGLGGRTNTNVGDGGGAGGNGGSNGGTTSYWAFGGGAGGYSGAGGNGGVWQGGGAYDIGASAGAANSGAAGGAAMWAQICGVGIFGKGLTGAIGEPGSGGTSIISGKSNKGYGFYGGGGSGHGSGAPSIANNGQVGAVRIVWKSGSLFPSTNVDAPSCLTDEELRTKGTPIGNMTQNGGLSAAFDGTTTGDYTYSARLDPSTGATIGKDFGENVTISEVVLHRPDGTGTSGSNCFPGEGVAALAYHVEYSNNNFEWMEVASSNGTASKTKTIQIGTKIVGRYWRVRFDGDGNGGSVRELEFKCS